MTFLIPSLKKLEKEFEKASTIITEACLKGRPIIIRHHHDTDGLCAGYALERAVLGIVDDKRSVFRSSCRAPYYSLGDAMRDLQMIRRDAHRQPVLVIMDTGSSDENSVAINLMKEIGCKVIVVDHHPLMKDSADVMINSTVIADDGRITGGMLGEELARVVNPNIHNISHLAALSGVADHVEGPELEKYLELAEKKGWTREKLHDLYLAIDFMMFERSESSVLIRELMQGTKQAALIKILAPKAKSLRKQRLEAIQKVAVQNGNVLIVEMDDALDPRTYPAPGRSIGLLYQQDKSKIIFGFGRNSVVIRGKMPKPIKDIVKELQNEFSGIEGGGHSVAGSIRFPQKEKNLIKEKLLEMVK